MNSKEAMEISPIIPVIQIDNKSDALPLAKALQNGGINIMEITLRTQVALEAIKEVSFNIPSMNVAAGTVCNEEDLVKSKEAGAKFVFSPGISQELIQASRKHSVTLIPGVSTASEVMLAQNNNIFYCKLFPAIFSGGIEILRAFAGPFPKMNFCPTGGINLNNLEDFLNLENVVCVGGTWLIPKSVIKEKNFEKITKLCQKAIEIIS